ncbi:uncharacterized protein LTR77_010299 [Saxophila tyrrhenica]|uniref:alcohol dehydrogenase n=1 Tax=Saxophila tyrrhenica TaxID=1690608 RepID=A0AAV9NVZ9_9PEZI|nr:hypothetical protein LTR77_010299 [Saxophila tyrrhenica]
MTSHIQPPVPSSRRFACETRVVSGLGCISTLANEIKFNKITKPALVVDAGIANAGLLEQWLTQHVSSITPCISCPVNPNLDQVQQGVNEAKSDSCDGVVIIGGGSAICMGKAIAICLANPGHILDYEGNERLKASPAPTICVPTTAGSGSEVSRVLVLHERGRRQEIIVRAMGSEPRVALLDGNLLKSAPRQPLLDAGLDAVTHACESLWSRNRSIITDALAEKALETFLDRFPTALNYRDPKALQDIIEASCAANLACGNTGLALCHAMNTAPDVPLAHGYVNGCTLPAVAAFNRPHMDERHQKLIDRLPKLYRELNCSGSFADGECDENNTELFVDGSRDHPFRHNNIRETTDAECYELLRQSGAVVAAAS